MAMGISRRGLLAGGISLAGTAAAGYALVEAGTLPGKYRLAQALGQCGAAPPPPHGPLPVRDAATFWSAYRKRVVRMVTLIPPAAARRPGLGRLGVVVALHGLGGSALGAASLYAPAMTQAGITRFAMITVDGGSTYWHERPDGDDPLGMIIHEVLPRAAARGLSAARVGIIGYSMGGYGALLLAERLGARDAGGPRQPVAQPAAAAVAAASPAIFASYRDAMSADPGAFASSAEFAGNNVMDGLAALRHIPAWVSCGSIDPFEAITQLLRSRLARLTGRPAAGGIAPGCHDDAFWARSAPSGLAFLGKRLG